MIPMDNQSEGLTARESRTLRGALIEAAELLRGAGIESAHLDAEVLLCHVLRIEQAEFYLGVDSAIRIEDERRVRELLLRRVKREPLAYITGRKEFWSLDFAVTPDVLIPRPDTELLVELTLERAQWYPCQSSLRILDVGTGSGAIAISLAKELPEAQIWAVDVSAAALKIARVNSARHGVASRIRFLQGDLFEPVSEPEKSFDVIVSNPPYIRSGELSELAPEIRDWEPTIALDGGPDGLATYRRIVDKASRYLVPGGHVLLEIGDETDKAVAELAARAGDYGTASVHQDYAGKDRVIAATRMARRDYQSFSRG